MIEESFARLRTHRNNIQRYRQLLETKLTELERQFIERRRSEEQSALETLAATTFPLTFEIPKAPTQDPRAT
jgi:predicted house-cleaning noncanonical NTP pyrophosphatase (MazG superfamily)